MIDITGLSKAAVLAALYNRARPQGLGLLHYNPRPMTEGEAQSLLQGISTASGNIYFDYLFGRVMKVDLSSDTEFDERLYDRDNGEGAAAAAIRILRGDGMDGMSAEELLYSVVRDHRVELVFSPYEDPAAGGRGVQVIAEKGRARARVFFIPRHRQIDPNDLDLMRRCIEKAVNDVLVVADGKDRERG